MTITESERRIKYSGFYAVSETNGQFIDLEFDRGWMGRIAGLELSKFQLIARPESNLPTIEIDLRPLPSGEKKRLIYFSRVVGTVSPDESGKLNEVARLYAVGWQATVNGVAIKNILWVYPSGSIVAADEPPYIDQLISESIEAK